MIIYVLFQDIVTVLKSAGETLAEVSKDSPSDDVVNARAAQFVKSLEVILNKFDVDPIQKRNIIKCE